MNKLKTMNESSFLKLFMGFISGATSQNFDIGQIFIDAFKKLVKADLGTTEWVFKRLEKISEKSGVDFILSISEDPAELPEFIAKYVI